MFSSLNKSFVWTIVWLRFGKINSFLCNVPTRLTYPKCVCVARPASVNPIRLAGGKRWRPGAPKLVMWAHPWAQLQTALGIL